MSEQLLKFKLKVQNHKNKVLKYKLENSQILFETACLILSDVIFNPKNKVLNGLECLDNSYISTDEQIKQVINYVKSKDYYYIND